MIETNLQSVLKGLENVRETEGEDAYLKARDSLVRMLIHQPNGEDFLKKAFPDLDLDPFKAEETRIPFQFSAEVMLALIQKHVPSVKTQGQFDLFMLGFNALALAFDSIFSGRYEIAADNIRVLNGTLETAKKLQAVQEKAAEVPEDQRGPLTQTLMSPPKQFSEIETQRRLLAELDSHATIEALSDWYKSERGRIDSVVTLKYRNELFDAIRKKQGDLAN